jgi:hypothetical protein
MRTEQVTFGRLSSCKLEDGELRLFSCAAKLLLNNTRIIHGLVLFLFVFFETFL